MNGSNQSSFIFSPKSASKKSTASIRAPRKGSRRPRVSKLEPLTWLTWKTNHTPHTSTTPHYFLGHRQSKQYHRYVEECFKNWLSEVCKLVITKIVDLRLHIAAEHFRSTDKGCECWRQMPEVRSGPWPRNQQLSTRRQPRVAIKTW